MCVLQLNVPDEVLLSLKETPETLGQAVRLAAAVKLYELGKLSSGRAAQLAGISRAEFLLSLGRYRVCPFPSDAGQLERDLAHA